MTTVRIMDVLDAAREAIQEELDYRQAVDSEDRQTVEEWWEIEEAA